MTMIGSARSDENGKLSGGKAGDQTSKEVSTQSYYMHSKGWMLLRAKDNEVANKIASAMIDACANNNIGYDQGQRDSIISLFKECMSLSEIDKPCECDCSKLVQVCVWEATGKDPGNFTTAGAVTTLFKTGYFDKAAVVEKDTPLYTGDILCTKTKGHIVVVTDGEKRTNANASNNKVPEKEEPKKEQTVSDKKYIATSALNLRKKAGLSHIKLGIIPKGGTCTLVKAGYKSDGMNWCKVKYAGVTGYVAEQFLSEK